MDDDITQLITYEFLLLFYGNGLALLAGVVYIYYHLFTNIELMLQPITNQQLVILNSHEIRIQR